MNDSFDFNNIGQRLQGSDNADMPSPPSPHQNDDDAEHHSSRKNSGNVTVYQTTGPDAYTSPILSPGGSGAPTLNPRSCVTCRRRKVRCDKQMPCSNCRRAQIPCVFPAPGRAPRQPRPKDPNAPAKNSSQREVELIKRLKKLEGIVEELSGQIDVDPTQAASNSASPDIMSVPQRQLTGSLDYASGQSTSPRGSDSTGSEGRKVAVTQQSFGRLVLDDQKGTSRYVSSRFWSKLNDEVMLPRRMKLWGFPPG